MKLSLKSLKNNYFKNENNKMNNYITLDKKDVLPLKQNINTKIKINTEINKVLLNENLIQIIFSFLSISDIINFTSSNKKIKENNDKIFNEICKKIYTSIYDEYSILNTQIEENNERKKEELNIESNLYFKIKWKSLFLIGKKIQFLWKNISLKKIPSFQEDSIKFSSQFYSILKGKN